MFTCDVIKIQVSHAVSLAVNYRLFSHGDVSHRLNGKNDNVVLELNFVHANDTAASLSMCLDRTTHLVYSNF